MEVKAMFAKLAKTKKEAKVKELKATASEPEQIAKKPSDKSRLAFKGKPKGAKPVVVGKKVVIETAEASSRRRKTDEGFKIYTEDELGLGDAGNTPDCPFDCSCCV